jgi:DNA-binding transcriptional MocR family regulator
MCALVWTAGKADGMCFPSYETIANRAGCARSTVGEQLQKLRAAGLITWQHRIGRAGEHFNKVVRFSNSYCFRWMGAWLSKSDFQSGPAKQQFLRGTNEWSGGPGALARAAAA